MRRHIRWRTLCAYSFMSVLVQPAQASTFRQYSASELVHETPLIVRATASLVEPTGNYGPEGRPCTLVQLKVHQVLKGNPETSSIEFCQSGGVELSGRVSIPIGAPAFTQGSKYLLFLNPRTWVLTPVVNWTAGAYREVQDGDRTVYIAADGSAVTSLDEEGFHFAAGEADESEQMRLLKASGVALDLLHIKDDGSAETLSEASGRRAKARARCARVDDVLAALHGFLLADMTPGSTSVDFDPYSIPFTSRAGEEP